MNTIYIQNFLKQFTLNGDGKGFWDEYKKKDEWLGNFVEISIAVRSMSEDIYLLFEKMMENQLFWDKLFKEFAANKLLQKIKNEWEDENLSEEMIVNELVVSSMTFGYESDVAFGIWFRNTAIRSEHGVQVYGDIQGDLIRAAME